MEKRERHHFLLVAFGVALFAALTNLGAIIDFFGHVSSIVFPVLLGFMIAFVLNVPMNAFERLYGRLFSKSKKQPKAQTVALLALVSSVLCVLLVVVLVFTLLLPALVSSCTGLYTAFMAKWPEYKKLLSGYNIDTDTINSWLYSLDIPNLIKQLANSSGSVISGAIGFVSSAVNSVISFVIAVIIGIYALLAKPELSRHAKKLLVAHLKEPAAKYIVHVATLLKDTYSKFLSGQCVEACILGVLLVIALSIFAVPYAALIGVLGATMSFIPYVGAVGACGIGAFLVAISDPSKVIVCVIVYLVVQFIETQFIYPHVVGTSVGLSPLWTLVAVLVGGELMGIFGMIFFIPLMAVISTLLREHTNKLIKKKQERSAERHITE